MLLVNGKKFTVYELDTRHSIMARIAVIMDTLIKYLYFPDKNEDDVLRNLDGNLSVKDLLKKIKKDASGNTEFKTCLDKIEPYIGSHIDVKKDILYVWLAYNTEIEKITNQVGESFLLEVAQNLVEQGYFEEVDDFNDIWDDRETIRENLEANIEHEKQQSKTHLELYEIFNRIDEGLVSTPFDVKKVSLGFSMGLKDISLLELFNYATLNETVPLSTCKNYYKILKDFLPPEEWISEPENEAEILNLKLSEKPLVNTQRHIDYTDVKISQENSDIRVNVKLTTEPGYITRTDFLTRFKAVFPKLNNIKYEKVDETNVIGLFFFPTERIDTYVFSDLVMNNRLFSTLINIDESSKATKRKTEESQPWLYINFNHPSTGRVTASIIQKFGDKNDPETKDIQKGLFPPGEPFIRVRVKGRDKAAIDIFQKILSKLLVVYDEEYNTIVEEYRKFLPKFGEVLERKISQKETNYDPKVFVSNYSRYCNQNRLPKVISEKRAKKEKKKGNQVMLYPRDIQENKPHYSSDGVDQQYYICTNPDFPYPGLRENKLSNSADYPFVPCCYKIDQMNKKNSLYRKYFFSEEYKDKEKRQQELIITDKILGPDQYGVLPPELEKMFQILDFQPNQRYIRVGLHRNHSSFLNAVMVSLHDTTNILDFEDEKEREGELLRIRKDMSRKDNISVARQCSYDISPKQLRKMVKNGDVYMDPKRVVQLVEKYFHCNIYLFNKEKMMFLPDHLQSYYTYRRTAPSVFIYENYGSESDKAKYPQCELIVKWNTLKSDDTQYVFANDDNISGKIQKIFSVLRQSYALNKKIYPIVFPLNDTVKIIEQRIDTYGKTRQLNVEFSGKTFTLLTSPIPPLVAEENAFCGVNKAKIKDVIDFFRKMEISIESQTVSQGMVKELNSTIGNVKISIPTQDTEKLAGVPVSDFDLHYPDSKTSAIQTYNFNKKIARYISEYVFWLFSKFVSEKNVENISDKTLKNFAKKFLKIEPDFKYKSVAKTFSKNSTLMSDGKLVVTSKDMLRRLLYLLKLHTIRDLKTLLDYKDKNAITNYYVDITDFDHNPKQVILQESEAVDIWIQENKFSYDLSSEVIVGKRTPYFFKNSKVENKVFLAQNVENLEKAIDISVVWQRRGYNIGFYAEKSKKYAFTLYSYTNSDSISEYYVKGKRKPISDIRILGYKLEGKDYYTALLEL